MKRILKYDTCDLKKMKLQIKKDKVQLKKLGMNAVGTGFEVCMIKIHQCMPSHCVPICISSTASLIPFAFIDGDRNYTLVCYIEQVLLSHSYQHA